MKKKINIILILAIILYVVFSIKYYNSFAITNGDLLGGTERLNDVLSSILGLIRWVGSGICIGCIIYKGILFILASPEGKANIKNHIIMFTIGFVLIFFGTKAVEVISDWFANT